MWGSNGNAPATVPSVDEVRRDAGVADQVREALGHERELPRGPGGVDEHEAGPAEAR